MLPEAALKDLLHQPNLTNTDKVLVVLAVDAPGPMSVKVVRERAYGAGLRKVQKWNLSKMLDRANPLAIRTPHGWELTSAGIKHVSTLAGPFMGSPAPKIAASLRSQLLKLPNPDVSKFVEEAIACHETQLHRAAVVLSWIGAIGLLYDFVIKNKVAEFNKEAQRRNPKWKTAITADDLSRMRESAFLDILETISVIGKNVKQELENCLKFRNGCGHPSSLRISDNRVAGHIESLILNVFARFS